MNTPVNIAKTEYSVDLTTPYQRNSGSVTITIADVFARLPIHLWAAFTEIEKNLYSHTVIYQKYACVAQAATEHAERFAALKDDTTYPELADGNYHHWAAAARLDAEIGAKVEIAERWLEKSLEAFLGFAKENNLEGTRFYAEVFRNVQELNYTVSNHFFYSQPFSPAKYILNDYNAMPDYNEWVQVGK
jgi:hypothetical protein